MSSSSSSSGQPTLSVTLYQNTLTMPLLGNGYVEMLIANGTAPYSAQVVSGWASFRMEVVNNNTWLWFNVDSIGVGSGNITVRITDTNGLWADVVVFVTVESPSSSSASSSTPPISSSSSPPSSSSSAPPSLSVTLYQNTLTMPLQGNGYVEMLIANGTAPYSAQVVSGWASFRMEIHNNNTELFFNVDSIGVGSGNITVRITDTNGLWADVVVLVTVGSPSSSSASSSTPPPSSSSSAPPPSSSQPPPSSSQPPHSSSQPPHSSSQPPHSSSQPPHSSSQPPHSSSQPPPSSSQPPPSS
ncbi:MAG: hypothetical protein WA117_18775, partial [Verrucomicrobiia bacterium]